MWVTVSIETETALQSQGKERVCDITSPNNFPLIIHKMWCDKYLSP